MIKSSVDNFFGNMTQNGYWISHWKMVCVCAHAHFSIIVHGPSAFEEDKWHTFTITHNYGTTLKFHYVMPRALCKVNFHSNCSALCSLFPQIFFFRKKAKKFCLVQGFCITTKNLLCLKSDRRTKLSVQPLFVWELNE